MRSDSSHKCSDVTKSMIFLVYLFVCLLDYFPFICLFVCVFCLYVCLFNCLYVCIFVCLFVYLFVYLCVCLLDYLFNRLFVCLFVCLFCFLVDNTSQTSQDVMKPYLKSLLKTKICDSPHIIRLLKR